MYFLLIVHGLWDLVKAISTSVHLSLFVLSYQCLAFRGHCLDQEWTFPVWAAKWRNDKTNKMTFAQRRLRSAWANQSYRCPHDAQDDLSLRWAHSHFVGFVMSLLMSFHLNNNIYVGEIAIYVAVLLSMQRTNSFMRWLTSLITHSQSVCFKLILVCKLDLAFYISSERLLSSAKTSSKYFLLEIFF